MASSEEAPTSVITTAMLQEETVTKESETLAMKDGESVTKEPETLDMKIEETITKEPETLVVRVEETQSIPTYEAQIKSSAMGGAEESVCMSVEVPIESNAEVGAETIRFGSSKGRRSKVKSFVLMERGSKAIKDGDFTKATDCLSRALEIRVRHYGELAPECASAYYKYGCALLYKAQEEMDPLGTVPNKADSVQNSEKNVTTKSAKNGVCSITSGVSDLKQDGGSKHSEGKLDDGACKKLQVVVEDEGSGCEDSAKADEDDFDLDLAWKMLDIARAIVEKHPEDTMEKVNILSALGEVALEREDIETSIGDYLKALSIIQGLVEADSQQIAELNFRICLCLEVGSKPEAAIPYCEKAISICKIRLDRLMNDVKNLSGLAPTITNVGQVCESSAGFCSDTYISCKKAEIKTLTELSSELEKKLEDLQQLVLNPSPVLTEILKMFSSKSTDGEETATSTALSTSQMGTNKSGGDITSPTVGEKGVTSAVLRSSHMDTNNNDEDIGSPTVGEKSATSTELKSSQMGTVNSGGDTDSSTASTAHTNGSGSVTHLGVVGRGVKRTSHPVSAESSPLKKPSLESNDDGGVS